MFKTIAFDLSEGVLTLTLNRPDRLNAFLPEMGAELAEAFDRADSDDEVRAIIVTGAGRAFCAGADLSVDADPWAFDLPIHAPGQGESRAPRDKGGLLALRIYRSLKPVIGAVNGPAVGFGATMLLPMDIRLAAQSARFGFPFVRRGIVPEAASSFFLPRVVGINRALEWTLTGRVFDAAEAKEAGLVRSIHADGDLMGAARAVAREVSENAAPVSASLTRQMMWRGLSLTEPMDAHRLDSHLMYARGRSADASEGVASFLQKRSAVFPGRVSFDTPVPYPWWSEPEY